MISWLLIGEDINLSTEYIYIDESGDLGLSERSSKVLVISALITDDPKKLDRVIKMPEEISSIKSFKRQTK